MSSFPEGGRRSHQIVWHDPLLQGFSVWELRGGGSGSSPLQPQINFAIPAARNFHDVTHAGTAKLSAAAAVMPSFAVDWGWAKVVLPKPTEKYDYK